MVGLCDHRIHRAHLLPHREGGVGEVLVVGKARAVLADEDVARAAALVRGDVLREDVEHALDLGEGDAAARLEGKEGGADARRVGAIEGRRRGRRGSDNDQQDRDGERDLEEIHLRPK